MVAHDAKLRCKLGESLADGGEGVFGVGAGAEVADFHAPVWRVKLHIHSEFGESSGDLLAAGLGGMLCGGRCVVVEHEHAVAGAASGSG